MKKPMKNLSLPISMDDVLRGKSVEWDPASLSYAVTWRLGQRTEVRRQRSEIRWG
jgi:hypothetical protein